MKRSLLFPLLLALLLLPCAALGAMEVALTPQIEALDYDFTTAGDAFVVLQYTTPAESGWMTLYSESGRFTGTLPLTMSGVGGRVKVTVQDLNQHTLATVYAQLPANPDAVQPEGVCKAKVRDLTLTETPEGVHYTFTAEGADYLLLRYSTKQETGSFYVYPVDDAGHFAGDLPLPLTFARSYVTVKILAGNAAATYAEVKAQKGWQTPDAPEISSEGRLKGVVVCIDAGHQEDGEIITEPLGPGLSGTVRGKGGMARGTVTGRLEHIMTLEVAYMLRNELMRQGATVVMTRTEVAPFISNLDRCRLAEEGGAHILLRLHGNNRSGTPGKQGIMIYMPKNSDYAKALATPEAWLTMGQQLLDAMRTAVGYELTDKTGRATQTDNYVGNNWATMPSFLVEMGYMSNPREDVLLSTPVYQQWLAEGMAQGVYDIAVSQGWVAATEEAP